MSEAEAVQNAYRWALDTSARPKVPCLHMLAARQIQRIVDENDDYAIAHQKISEAIREWKREKRAGMERPIEILESMTAQAAPQ